MADNVQKTLARYLMGCAVRANCEPGNVTQIMDVAASEIINNLLEYGMTERAVRRALKLPFVEDANVDDQDAGPDGPQADQGA